MQRPVRACLAQHEEKAIMQIGMEQVFQSWGYDNITDEQVYDEELKLAVMAEQLGMDEV